MSGSGSSLPEAERVLRECAWRAAGGGRHVAPMCAGLLQAADRLREPLRLAVVGQIKRGKSTLVNAILGEAVAATGQLELTFTVSEFRHGDERAIHVRYKDGSVEGPLPPAALESLTARNPDALEKLRRIAVVEYAMPSDLLRQFRLVDTPGLGSVYADDARNSLDYLGLAEDEFAGAFTDAGELAAARQALAAMGRTAHDVHADSAGQAATADAMVYLFSRGLNPSDYDTVLRFLGPAAGSVTPLRAFGVLSRCDQYWPPGPDARGRPDPVTYDPMAEARAIADRYLARPRIGSLFYAILPVAGIVGIGARLLSGRELDALGELSKSEPKVLARSLGDAGRFATAAELRGITLPAAERARLIARLGGWGTHLACGYLREHLGEDEIRDRLVAASGVTSLRDLITRHFGNRSAIIKLDHGIQAGRAEIGRCRLVVQRAGLPEPGALTDIADRIDRLGRDAHEVAEVATLSAHYKGELELGGDEVRDLLTVTGEHGTSWAARLGLPPDTRPADLADAARRHAAAWSVLSQDPMLDRVTRSAARTVRRSYERLWQDITQHGERPAP